MGDKGVERYQLHIRLEQVVRELNMLVRDARSLDLDVTLAEYIDHAIGPYRVPLRWWELAVAHRLGRPLPAMVEDQQTPPSPAV